MFILELLAITGKIFAPTFSSKWGPRLSETNGCESAQSVVDSLVELDHVVVRDEGRDDGDGQSGAETTDRPVEAPPQGGAEDGQRHGQL